MDTKGTWKKTISAKTHDPRRPYFDADFYVRTYGIKDAPFDHYCAEGWLRGYSPNAFFNGFYYKKANKTQDYEPLMHYVENWKNVPFVTPVFSASSYVDMYPDVAMAGVDPFLHYLRHGHSEGRAPGFPLYRLAAIRKDFPDFDWKLLDDAIGFPVSELTMELAEAYVDLIDEAFYRTRYGGLLGTRSPADHYGITGWREGLRPNALFDPDWYFRNHGIAHRDPVLDHVLHGRRPVPFFCPKSYSKKNPNLCDARTAFAQFLKAGLRDQRQLGVTEGALRAIRALDKTYDWSVAVEALPEPTHKARDCKASGLEYVGVLPAQRAERDAFMVSVFRSKSIGKTVVSFDVWDTLLRRDCAPDEVKLFAAHTLAHELIRLGRCEKIDLADLFYLRQLAEFRVANSEYEYTYLAMLREWLSLCGVESGPEFELLIDHMVEDEILREIAVTRPDPSALAMLESIQSETEVIGISDFYLPETALKRILSHHGITRYLKRIYVSSDLMRTKRGGGLFEYVLQEVGVPAHNVLHVGDNQHADYEMAIKHGIDALLFKDNQEEKRKRIMEDNFRALLSGDSAAVTQRLLGLMTNPAAKLRFQERSDRFVNQENDPLIETPSVDFLALLFGGFAQFILEKASAAKVEHVYFATREGNFIQKTFDLLTGYQTSRLSNRPSSSILEVSRRATFAASLREVSLAELMRMWSLYSSQSMRAFALSLNVDEAQMKKFCLAYEIEFEQQIPFPWQDPRIARLFDNQNFCTWLSHEIAKQRESLWSYLEHSGFEPHANKRRFMVDIGWRGSIQDNLAFIVNGWVGGAYLALYQYLYPQPANSKKYGFLVDHNVERTDFHVGDFAAFEFVANGLGGSVVSYRNGTAIREVFEAEEILIQERIIPLQNKILSRIEELMPVIRRTPLAGEGWVNVAREAARRFIQNPSPDVADIFQEIEHNESFGVGSIQKLGGNSPPEMGTAGGADFHEKLLNYLTHRRWPQSWLNSTAGREYLARLPLHRRLHAPRIPGLSRAPSLIRSLGHKISIFAPCPIRGSGGHRTIYNLAKALDRAGFNVHLFSESRGDAYEYKEQEIAGTAIRSYDHWFSGIVPELAIATVQYSAPYLTRFFPTSTAKAYFVQDFEAAFNPLSDAYVRGENSFAEGHNHICVGRWLTHLLRTQFGRGAASAGLGVDTEKYHPREELSRSKKIAVLYQPEKWRRLPELCLDALARVKSTHPDVEIAFYGSYERPPVSFPFSHLGLIDDLTELNKLYNTAMVGLCISLTNPSRIPYEMMAAGCVPVEAYRYNNLFDYETGTALLAYQTSQSLAAAMIHLLDNETELTLRRQAAISSSARRTLRWETDAAVNAIEFVLDGGDLDELPVPVPSYVEPPFCAPKDQTDSVQAWCNWQQKLAVFTP